MNQEIAYLKYELIPSLEKQLTIARRRLANLARAVELHQPASAQNPQRLPSHAHQADEKTQ